MSANTGLKLVVGLGNPGPEYEHSRHNAGFDCIELLARKYGASFRSEPRYKGEACRISLSGHSLWLLKPQTFMNRSGESVASLVRFYKWQPEQLLIVHDELDLPPGEARLKRSGGHGGHNGLRDIIAHLGANNFLRLRVGIGHPGVGEDIAAYVLRRAPLGEQRLLENALIDSIKLLPLIASGQLDKAMQTLHSRKLTDTT